MDTRRFVLAIVLMIAVVVVTNLLFPPAPPELPEQLTEPATPAEVAPDTQPGPALAPPAQPDTLTLAPVAVDTITIASPLYRYGFSTAGGSIVSAELLEFESFAPEAEEEEFEPVQLVRPDLGPLVRYAVEAGGRTTSLDTLLLAAEATSSDGADTLRFAFADPAGGLALELNYALDAGSYLIDVWGAIDAAAGPAVLGIELGPTLRINERREGDDERALAYVVNARSDGIRSTGLNSVDTERIEEGPLTWAAIKNKYFLVAALSSSDQPGGQLGGAIVRPVPIEHAAAVTATVPLAADGTFAFQLYLGPQQYDHLTAAGRSLEDANPYGWRVFRPIIRPLARFVTWALVGMHNILGLGYGWVLIAFGILIRVVLWPLNTRAMRAQLKNMELQPRIKEIQEKYRKEPEQLQREMLKLYREEGFNPLGGCLPMLIPFPVLITLFFVFQSTIEFRGVDFLWLPDLSQPDPFYILPVLLGASMFLMQWLSMRSTPSVNPQMKMMLWFMPGMMVIIFLNLASGLNLYYFSMNMASVPQQLHLLRERRRVQARMLVTPGKDRRGGPPEKPKPGGGAGASAGGATRAERTPKRPRRKRG